MKWDGLLAVVALALVWQFTQALECYKPGVCSGGQVTDYIENAETYNDCLNLCQADPDGDCQWFTHFEYQVCLHFNGCPTIVDQCTDCFSGQRNCTRGKEVLNGILGILDKLKKGEKFMSNVIAKVP